MNTKIQMSAELLGKWAAEARASRDATDILRGAAQELANEREPNIEALRTLLNALGYAGIGLSVFADLAENEARIALKVGESR